MREDRDRDRDALMMQNCWKQRPRPYTRPRLRQVDTRTNDSMEGHGSAGRENSGEESHRRRPLAG